MDIRIEQAILKTLVYSDSFSCPLNSSDLYKFLISESPFSFDAFNAGLKSLVDGRRVETRAGFYFLFGRGSLVEPRRKLEEISREKINRTRWLMKLISFLPWVRLVGITGALSYYMSPPKDDIDLMIVTSKGRMWLTRFLVFIFLKILGRKRDDKSPVSNGAFCVNLWCDEVNLTVAEAERDLVVAYDLSHLIPVINKGEIYQEFIRANIWLKTYLPNWSY